MSLFDDLKAAGCQIESHHSDFYVRATPEAMDIIRQHNASYSLFVSQIPDEALWAEVPFAFDPFWQREMQAPQSPVPTL